MVWNKSLSIIINAIAWALWANFFSNLIALSTISLKETTIFSLFIFKVSISVAIRLNTPAIAGFLAVASPRRLPNVPPNHDKGASPLDADEITLAPIMDPRIVATTGIKGTLFWRDMGWSEFVSLLFEKFCSNS